MVLVILLQRKCLIANKRICSLSHHHPYMEGALQEALYKSLQLEITSKKEQIIQFQLILLYNSKAKICQPLILNH